VVQAAACFVVDRLILAFLIFLAFRHIAEAEPDSNSGFDFDSGSHFGSRSIAVVDSASFAGFAVVESYVETAVVLVLVAVHVQVDHEMIQVSLDPVVHVVLVHLAHALALALAHEPALAAAFALDHAPMTLTQSSYSVDYHLLGSPSTKLPW